MPLKLIPPREGKTPNWSVNGTYLGVYVDRSARTNKRAIALQVLKKIEGEIERGEFVLNRVGWPATDLRRLAPTWGRMRFQPGNQEGKKSNHKRSRELARRLRAALERPIEQPLNDAPVRDWIIYTLIRRGIEEGDVAAIREILDRVDGKVPQAVVGDDDEPPIRVERIKRVIIDPVIVDPGRMGDSEPADSAEPA